MVVLELKIRQILAADGITTAEYLLYLGEWQQGGGDDLYLDRQPNPQQFTAEFDRELSPVDVVSALLPGLEARAAKEGYELCL